MALTDNGQNQGEQVITENVNPLEISDIQPNSEKAPFVVDFINRAIKMVPGVNIATSTKKFMKLSPDFYVSGVVECDTTQVTVSGTAAETTLNSYTVPLNMISRNYGGTGTSGRDFRKTGNAFRIMAFGNYTTNDAVSTVTLTLKYGSNGYHTITTTGGVASSAPWNLEWLLIFSTVGSSASSSSCVKARMNNINKDVAVSSATVDTTAANAISITATWTGGDASDSCTINQFLVELLN